MLKIGELFEKFYQIELRWLLPRVARPDDAEDVLSEAFIRACAYISEHPDVEIRYPRTWLRTVIRNSLIDHYRHRSRRPEVCDIEPAWDDAVGAMGENGDDAVDRWLEQYTAHEYLDQLMGQTDHLSHERDVLELRLSGCSYAEIVERVGLSSEAAGRALFFRAKERLAQTAASYFAESMV